MKIVTYTKQCHDYTMMYMYGIIRQCVWSKISGRILILYNSVLNKINKGISEREQSTFSSI